MNLAFEECHVYLTHQMLPKQLMRPFARPNNNLYSQTDNLNWRNHPNFSWGQNINNQPRPNFSNNFQPSHYQQNFPNHVPPLPLQNSQMVQDSPIWKKKDSYFQQDLRNTYSSHN